jgi:hypothetical protein
LCSGEDEEEAGEEVTLVVVSTDERLARGSNVEKISDREKFEKRSAHRLITN